jgi:diguanylate cyclase (GGDEF)-like protein
VGVVAAAGGGFAVVRLGAPGARSVRRRRAALPRRVAGIAGADNLLRILDEVIAAMDRPGLRGGAIMLINERNELYFGAHRGEVDAQVRDIRLPVGQGVVGRVAAEARPIVVADLDAPQPGVEPTNRSVGSNALTHSMVAVPVLFEGGMLGVLEMSSTSPGAFDESDVALLEDVAAAVAGAIAQANPLKLADEVLRRRVRELTTLQEAAEALNASLGLDVVLGAVVEHTARAVHTPYAAVFRVEDDAVHNVASHAGAPLDEAAVTRAVVDALAGGIAVGETRVATLPAPPGRTLPSADAGAPLRSVAMVHLRPGEFDAVLCVASPDARGFDPAQARLLDGIAHLASLAMANAVRYQHLAEAALTDPLTGLLRRSQFERLLAETPAQPVSVLAVDVDHLKGVNEAAGHEAGDQVLSAIAATLRDRLSAAGTLARTGGDEFGILLPGFEASTAIAVAEELRRAVYAAPITTWLPRVSIGVASAPAGGDPRSAWDAALEALARAKHWGRDRVEVVHTAGAQAGPRHAWDALVPQLYEAGGIGTVYQPIVRLSDHELVGHEALGRPAGFAADADVEGLFLAARNAGVHRDLDWACRRAAVRDAHLLPPGIPLFVNVGIWALIDPLHDVDQMLLLLRWMHISPRDIVLELSEREAVHDLDRLHTVMDAYRAHGFRFSIDDVGEGHSTLDMLAAGSPDYIKIARSLVSAADHPGARAAINAVVAFALSASATVIAEGVETEEEARRMETMGVPLGQGYWLGRPARFRDADDTLLQRSGGPHLAGPPTQPTTLAG